MAEPEEASSPEGSPGILSPGRARAQSGFDVKGVPQVEEDLEKYTKERIKVSLDFTAQRLARNPTPRTREILYEWNKTCNEAYIEGDEEKIKWLQTIERACSANDLPWLYRTVTPELQDMTQKLIELKWMQFLANFGDFVSIGCQELRKAARSQHTECWELLDKKKNWTQISAALKREWPLFQINPGLPSDEIGTAKAVNAACLAANLNIDSTINCIHLYAERNTAFHSQIKEQISAGKYSSVATTMHEFLGEIDSLCPESRREQGDLLREAILEKRDDWFDIEVEDDPENWTAKRALKELRRVEMIQEATQPRVDTVQHDVAVLMGFLEQKPPGEDDENATLPPLDLLPPERTATHHLEGPQGQKRQHSESLEEREQKFKRLCRDRVALYETSKKLKVKRTQTEMAMLTLQKAQDAEASSQRELMSRGSTYRRDLAS